MSFVIKNSQGDVVTTIANGIIDQSFNINLVGHGVASYGELMATNIFRLLENFAAPISPYDNPILVGSAVTGQLWYDTSAQKLKVAMDSIGVDWSAYIHDEANDFYGIRFEQLIPVLWKATQELSEKIETQKNDN